VKRWFTAWSAWRAEVSDPGRVIPHSYHKLNCVGSIPIILVHADDLVKKLCLLVGSPVGGVPNELITVFVGIL